MKKLYLLITISLFIFACNPPTPQESGPSTSDMTNILISATDVADEIFAADDLRNWIRDFSSDTMEGRAPGTPGDSHARQWLIQELEKIGLNPGAESGWEQTFELVGVTTTMPESWSFWSSHGGIDFSFGEDAIAVSGVQNPQSNLLDAEVVFVGYGIDAPEYGWNDFGGDLEGKILLMLNNDPDWDADIFAGERRLYYGRWDYKYESAERQGAVGAIIIHTTPSAGYGWEVIQNSWTGAQFYLPNPHAKGMEVEAWMTEDAAKRLVQQAGLDLDELVQSAKSPDFVPVPLGLTTSLTLENKVNAGQRTANVLALLPGSDPQLSKEAVVFTAHHDHLGVGPAVDGDSIFNGALDNASGVAQVLAVAKAMKSLDRAPRRSVLFAFVAAEEQGLLGSEYYTQHPTFLPGRIAANINIDGANIWGRTKDLVFIGYGKSSLDSLVDQWVDRQGRKVTPDQHPDKGYFYRSDQFNFAKIGVPAMYLDTGSDFIDREEGWGQTQTDAWTAAHYHQRSDEIRDDWDFEGMLEDLRIAFLVGLEVAETEAKPSWNVGDEFEASRLEALEALEIPK